ncbi:Non-structural maintenance of chromosomes element 4-like protein A [Bienertia sinuspersici]
MIDEVESLHKKVRKPREQVADAEALLDITSSFVKSVKAQKNEGVSPSDFVSCLMRDFSQQVRGTGNEDDSTNLILWKDIGLAVSHIFRKGTGCCTMLGPMSSELKKRKTVVRRKHVKPTDTARPEELDNTKEEKTDTDKNMSTMFGILRKNRRVRLENLILNRSSFAQTVENLFALSFLVKDGRAEITANSNGHYVCPRNAPAAEAVASGKVSYSHFVFRFDFKDWKLMLDSVGEGEELMPHRAPADTSAQSELPVESENVNPEPTVTTTPIRKLSRNRGLVLQEQTVVEESPEYDDNRSRGACIRRGKRKII